MRSSTSAFAPKLAATPLAQLADAAVQQLAHLGREAADGAAQLGGVGDHVAGLAGAEGAHRDDADLLGVEVAGDDRLERHHELRADEHRVHGLVGVGAVAAAAAHQDAEAVGGGHHRAGAHHGRAEVVAGGDVQAEGDVGAGAVEHAVGDHGVGAAEALLGRLKHQLDRAGDLVAVLHQHAGDADADGDVGVVAAGVHHAGRLRAVGDVVLLVDGQGVHVEAQQHRALAGQAALEQADHAGLADAALHLVAEGAEFLGDDAGGADLLEAELGVHVQVAPDRRDLVGEGLGVGEERVGHGVLL
jgi:hypothetical protein